MFDEIPDYVSMLEAWGKGERLFARNETTTFPKEKEDWVSETPKAKQPGLYEKVTLPVMRGFKKMLPGYYEEGNKIPEELK